MGLWILWGGGSEGHSGSHIFIPAVPPVSTSSHFGFHFFCADISDEIEICGQYYIFTLDFHFSHGHRCSYSKPHRKPNRRMIPDLGGKLLYYMYIYLYHYPLYKNNPQYAHFFVPTFCQI